MNYRFWTRWEAGGDKVQRQIIEFAQSKLICNNDHSKISDKAKIAVLARRLLLEFEPKREAAVRTETELVAAHMHVAYSVPAHREYLRSGAPSEPILAEAAARIMASNHFQTAEILSEYLSNGLITRGERGELVGRLLLIQAFDAAVMTKSLRDRINPIHFSVAIPVIDFLVALFPANYKKTFCQAISDNLPGATLQDAFRNAVVYFTHWGKAADSSVINDDSSWKAMTRGMAIQCHNHQEDIDFLLPVLFDDKQALSRFVMTAIFIQIKNRDKKQSVNISAERLRYFTPGNQEQNSRPYITIVMELGLKWKMTSFQSRSKASITNATQAQGTPSKISVKQPTDRKFLPRKAKKGKLVVHPRYSFLVTGCSESVYRVIPSGQRDIYQGLLGSHSLLAQHPRANDNHVDAVLQMKPFWTNESFRWAKSSKIDSGMARETTDVVTNELNESVVTGPFPDFSDEEDT
jgi:hypothetical protein